MFGEFLQVVHILLKLLQDEIASKGYQILVASNIASNKLADIGAEIENQDETGFLSEDDFKSRMAAGGLLVENEEQLAQLRMYRKKKMIQFFG